MLEMQTMTHEESVKRHQTQLRNQKISLVIRMILTYLFLVVFALYIIIPFYWMVNVSLQTNAQAISANPVYFPDKWVFHNYVKVMTEYQLGRYMINTVAVGAVSTAIGTVLTIFMAFALSRLQFRGKDALFSVLLATMMIPGEMMVLTNYLTVSKFGWIAGTGEGFSLTPYLSMTVPFFVSVFNVYQLRQAFKIIPNELYYAAKVDGTSDWKYLWRVMVPQAKSTITMIIILKLMASWNSYAWPNLVAEGDYRLITNGLREAFSSGDDRNPELQMAATIIVTLPLLIVFMIFRKSIMKGVSRSGIKG
ncbi:carbohydrate ABC transporter permease [Acholeplasma sp. OttesenSCG-928-E16]|nr:carbohydrate ABC transporter permease [Acholeplasma sp. OttesenSCG-928-E16]